MIVSQTAGYQILRETRYVSAIDVALVHENKFKITEFMNFKEGKGSFHLEFSD